MAVQKYTAKNGKTLWRFSVWYTDWTGTRKRKKQEGFKTQREAKEAETTFVNSKRTDVDITFGNLVKVYFENRSARIEKTTLATKEHMIRTKILPYFENLPLSEIDTAAVMKWQTELMNYRNPKTGNPYAQTYLRQIHNQLSTIFNFAVKYYGLLRNPAQLCGSMGKQNAEKFDFWTYNEFQRFIQTTEENMLMRTIFTLLFYSGMREGELLALTLNDFDFEKGTVSISKSLAVIKGEAVVKATKTPKSNRVIALRSLSWIWCKNTQMRSIKTSLPIGFSKPASTRFLEQCRHIAKRPVYEKSECMSYVTRMSSTRQKFLACA